MTLEEQQEQHLLELCSKKYDNAILTLSHWTAEVYGFGKHIREYGFYPKQLPLLIHSDHGGPGISNKLHPIDFDNRDFHAFFHSPRIVKLWNEKFKIKAYCLYSPFVFYRKKNNIIPKADARGTLVYPAHTTPSIDDNSNIEKYIEQIMSLPKEFHPVSVSLHYHDINKRQHKLFQKYKIPVYTAGSPYSHLFTERFYSILSTFKYSTSNMPMSCLFYSVEMGIPHFIYGNEPDYYNKADTNVKMGQYDTFKKDSNFQKIMDLFKGISMEISPEQKKFVEFELGLHNGTSRLFTSYILYKSYFEKILLPKLQSKLKMYR